MAQPTPDQLQHVAHMFTEGLTGPARGDVDATRRVNEYIQCSRGDPTFNTCLSIIATSPSSGVSEAVRQQTAFALKNSIVQMFDSAISPMLPQIQQRLLGDGTTCGLADPHEGTRKAIAGCISTLANACGLALWPGLLPGMLQQLQVSGNEVHRNSMLVCMRNVCEDCAQQIDTPIAPQQPAPAETLVPEIIKMMATTGSPSELLITLECLFALFDARIVGQTPSTVRESARAGLDPLMQGLSRAMELSGTCQTPQESAAIRTSALRCYRKLEVFYSEIKAKGSVPGLFNLAYTCTNDANGDVALAACEFWNDVVTNQDAVRDIVENGMLAQLLEQLLDKMTYSDLDVSMIMDEEQRENVNPLRYRRTRHNEDDSAMHDVEQWTLRQCAATIIDSLSTTLGDRLVTPPGTPQGWLLNTQIRNRLQHQDWRVQEAAVLALGAIAIGCGQAVVYHLGDIIELLMAAVADGTSTKYHFLVRSISCWTLSRYDESICRDPQHHHLYGKYLELLLEAMTDQRRRVQECAVSAFAELIDESQHDICEPAYLELIVRKVAPCFKPGAYTTRNLVILLDAVGHLVRTAGADISTPAADEYIFKPLIRGILPTVRDDDVETMPRLLHCIFNVALGLGSAFAPFVEEVYKRCLLLVGHFFTQQYEFSKGNVPEAPESYNCYVAFDVIGAIVMAMETHKAQIEALLGSTKYPGTDFTIFQFVLLPFAQSIGCAVHLKMAGMGLIGECLRRFPLLTVQPTIEVLHAVLADCNEDDDLCNDSCWFCGEVALVLEAPHVTPENAVKIIGTMANTLVPIIVANEWHSNLLQNCAIAVGRFGLVQPQLMGKELGSFIIPLTKNLSAVRDTNEKEQGFLGIVRMLQHGGFATLQDVQVLRVLLEGFASFRELSVDVGDAFKQILRALKQAIPDSEWPNVLSLAPQNFPRILLMDL